MRYSFYRCITENCGAIVTSKTIEKKGCCKSCGGHKVRPAFWYGFNLPKIREWPLIWLRLR